MYKYLFIKHIHKLNFQILNLYYKLINNHPYILLLSVLYKQFFSLYFTTSLTTGFIFNISEISLIQASFNKSFFCNNVFNIE